MDEQYNGNDRKVDILLHKRFMHTVKGFLEPQSTKESNKGGTITVGITGEGTPNGITSNMFELIRKEETAFVDFGVVVHSGSLVGGNVHIGSGAIIGPNVTIGQSTKIGYNVAIANYTIGDSCVIHHGVYIAQFFIFLNIQTLKALRGNTVEIGANSCIDRGS
ncbi:probable UDP-3-O-acylglucosamine N-acyltransferase 2, mitochondrial [Lactuca sativa]|uniref:probable UDP-3-O-acylglucosamine N-acyltransferase 2, mitochondrial n=1 Tax=Lactuca sativa TaxID=4236 RepID=UPI001C689B7A|nr:probable UDP-3-O-acylglucosamine N-acyltransferase 2, mitochondrial [Lactuca sativa]